MVHRGVIAVTWPTLVAGFLDSRRERAASPRTVAAYANDLAYFAKWYGAHSGTSVAPERVTALDVAAYRSWLADRYRPTTVNRRISTVRSTFGWAASEGLLARSPAERLRLLPTMSLGPRGLEGGQLAALLDAAGRHSRRDAVLITLMAQTGLRISEALGLTWASVHLARDAGTVVVRRGKGSKYREVPLNATARRALTVWRQSQPATGAGTPVFPARSGRALAIRTAELALVRYSREAGIDPPATPHTLRHTFCKALVDAGESLDRVAALAGHARLDTTARYTRPTRADLERSVGRLDPDPSGRARPARGYGAPLRPRQGPPDPGRV